MVKFYILVALVSLVVMISIPNILLKILFAWTACSLIAVSSAYLLRYPRLFRKRADGSIPFYIRWIFVPFLLGSWLYNEYARRNDKVPALQKIEPQLFLACRMSGKHIDLLHENQIDSILDVTAEFDGLDWTAYREDFGYLNIPVLDHTSPTPEQLVLAINWIRQQTQRGKNVVVHCALGRGRSVLVVAAYLLAKNPHLTVDNALAQINSIRQTARLNKRQLKALKKVKDGGLLSLHKKLTLVVNPVAGGGKWAQHKDEVLARLNEKFSVSVLETTPDINANHQAQQALEHNADIVVACGGDGTLTEVASALIGSDIVMGIIPFGTANALSQVLHGYMTKVTPISTACDIIIKGETLTIDTATCNEHAMLLVAAVGFEEQMIASADREEKNEGGQFAYLKGLWKAVSNNQNTRLSVSLDNNPAETIETPSFVIANAAPITTVLAQGSARPDITDGKLDLTWLTPKQNSNSQFLSLAELTFTPNQSKPQSDSIRHAQAKTITLSFDKKTTYALDGEIFEANKLVVNIRPKSLTVLANINQKGR